MPILGICRGIQIINVAHGGSLRDLRDDDALHEAHGITSDSLKAHDVEIIGDSRLADVIAPQTERRFAYTWRDDALS